MMKARIVLLSIATGYLLTTLFVSGQYLDRKVAIIEQRLENHIHDVTEPAIAQLNALEEQIRSRDLAIEGRLAKLEQSVATINQLVLAIGTGVLIQLISAGIGVLRSYRQNQKEQT